MSVVHPYIYVKRSKTCGRASSDKGSDSFSHPQTRFSTPQCNYTAVYASSRSVFTAQLAVSCLNTIQSFLRNYSLSALCLGFCFLFFLSSVQSGIGKTDSTEKEERKKRKKTTESSAKRGRNIKRKNRATVNSAARLTSASPFARSSSNHKKVPKISPKRPWHNFQMENLFFFFSRHSASKSVATDLEAVKQHHYLITSHIFFTH